MADTVNIKTQNPLQRPYTITKEIFAALGPLEQAAAKALEKFGYVRIVEQDKNVGLR